MSFKTAALNVLSLGGHAKLESVRREYTIVYQEYVAARDRLNGAQGALLKSVSDLGRLTKQVMLTLDKSYKLISYVNTQEPPTRHEADAAIRRIGTGYTANDIPQLISAYNAVASTVGGVGAGSAVAIGSWSLVSLVGAASTGTAITSLSGVAATNATLAWFGGGALAAGGAGMAGGTLVLGGLVLVPLIAIATWHSRSQIKEVTDEICRLKSEQSDMEKAIALVIEDKAIADKKILELGRRGDDLAAQFRMADIEIFPSIFSRFTRYLKRLMMKPAFDKPDLDSIEALRLSAGRVAELFRA